ncbi:DUF7519 family protein [Halopiger xanaduensis]|uniref:Uncharacterized protein n=1 Tax=Halopiger xanaduensis (strain DSM 18323 / JCM 14033 / SH-6) TaxID=797210 RepID=F8DAH6_HALXS|nr:hypothetical protein [Halopiger xanaduensis]AEH35781.1 hypothetical protein Halxa_1148 [Halopiger xanaduensis SH-6]
MASDIGEPPEAAAPTRRDPSRAPETTSAPVTALTTILATLAGALALAIGIGSLVPAVAAVAAGCLLTGTVTATKRRTPGGRAVGSCLVVFAALGIAAAAGLEAATGVGTGAGPGEIATRIGVVVAVGLAAFGATATVTGAIGDGAVRSAIPVAVATTLPLAVVGGVHLPPVRNRVHDLVPLGDGSEPGTGSGAAATDGGLELARLFSPENTMVGVATFVALLVAALWTAYFVLPRLPIPELLPRDRRADVRWRIRLLASRAGWGGWTVLLVGGALTITAALSRATDEPYLDSVYPLLESTAVPLAMAAGPRVAFVGAIVVLIAALLVSRLPGLYRLRYHPAVRWLPVLTGGTLVSLLVLVGYPRAFDRLLRPELEALGADGEPLPVPVIGTVPTQELSSLLAPSEGIAIIAIVVAGVISAAGTLFVAIWLLGSLRLLPDRGAPGSLAAGALVGGAIAAAVAGASTPVVSAAVACAIVAWDSAVYGVSIVEELGREPTIRRPAVAHATGAVVVGVVGIALALGFTAVLERATVRTGATVVISLTVALLAALVVLKRRATAAAAATES